MHSNPSESISVKFGNGNVLSWLLVSFRAWVCFVYLSAMKKTRQLFKTRGVHVISEICLIQAHFFNSRLNNQYRNRNRVNCITKQCAHCWMCSRVMRYRGCMYRRLQWSGLVRRRRITCDLGLWLSALPHTPFYITTLIHDQSFSILSRHIRAGGTTRTIRSTLSEFPVQSDGIIEAVWYDCSFSSLKRVVSSQFRYHPTCQFIPEDFKSQAFRTRLSHRICVRLLLFLQ